ncbi:MAG: hypothetical protein HQ492_02780 [Woeseiaceae bacterium]|nr:hypothetical protein [Woeseiaceae bacterium]
MNTATNNTISASRILGALKRIVPGIFRLFFPTKNSTTEYFTLSYEERVETVQTAYAHSVKLAYLGDWLEWDDAQFRHEIQKNFRPYFDLMLSYADAINASAVLQLGGYTMTESRWLAAHDFPGRIIASDYDSTHIDYLRDAFSRAPWSKIEYRVVNLEAPDADSFSGVEMVVALAVLSNIQPEGMERTFAALAQSDVKCILIGDMYEKAAMTIEPTHASRSVPMTNAKNWAHPYMALARKHGFDAFFLPDFTYSSYLEARGVFVIYREIALDLHQKAIASAMRNYIERQPTIWPNYASETHSGLVASPKS